MIETIAATVVAKFLLPYVTDGLKAIGEKVAETAGEAAGEQAVDVTKRAWARVKGLFAEHPEHEGALREFEEDPDEVTVKYLEKRLAKLLEADPAAAQELSELTEARAEGTEQTIATVIGNSGVTVTIVGSTLTNSPTTISTVAPPPDRGG